MPRFAVLALIAAATFGGLAPARAQRGASDDAARDTFRIGEAAYSDGRFEEALLHFERAYELSHRPQLLFNIGQAADRSGDRRRALAAFEAYLAEVESSANRAFVQSRIDVLRREFADADPSSEPPGPGVEEAPAEDESTGAIGETERPSRTRRIAGWTSVGIGGTALVLGTVFLALGIGDYHDITDAPDGVRWTELERPYDRSVARVATGGVLIGVGAVASAIGVTLALRAPSSDETASIDLRIAGDGILVRGRF